MPTVRIVLLCMGAAVAYGILQDQVTARISVEYFTIGHPPIVPTNSPTVLGFVWGILGTWWVGLFLGLLLAAAARIGTAPKRAPATLARPVMSILIISAFVAALSGSLGFILAQRGSVELVSPLAESVPSQRHVSFVTAAWVHSASYLSGGVLGAGLAVRVWLLRRRPGESAA